MKFFIKTIDYDRQKVYNYMVIIFIIYGGLTQ